MGCERADLAAALFKAAQAGIVIIDADTKTVVDINPAASIMIGAAREDVIGKACYEYLCVDKCEGCPVLTEELKDGHEIIENKEIILSRKDGSIVFALLTINSVVFEDKRLFINTLIDISKQKEMEAQLSEHWSSAEKMLAENVVRLKNGVI